MSRTPGYYRFFPMVLAWATCSSLAESLPERIDAVVPPGFSGQIVVGTPDEVLYAKSFGLADRESGRPVTDDTLFDIGSITKTFTATALLTLVESGHVRLDQTIADWFDPVRPEAAGITVHQLLTHMSGLPMYSGDDDEPCDRVCFDAWVAEVMPDHSPGERFQYSNPGYSVLARIIEKESGLDYEAFLRERLVEPLELGEIGYVQLPVQSVYAVGYFEGRRVGLPIELGWASDGPPWHLRGNGGLLTSADGLYRWLRSTATGRTLGRDLRSRQFARHAERREDVWYGYGWDILRRPWGTVIDHTGGNGFFFADARWFQEGDLLVVITNNAFDRESIVALLGGLRAALGLEIAD